MPQAWETHWKLPDELSTEERKANSQGIGNLTLVGKKLNPSFSSGPWMDTGEGQPGKRSGLHAHTMLTRARHRGVVTHGRKSRISIKPQLSQVDADESQTSGLGSRPGRPWGDHAQR